MLALDQGFCPSLSDRISNGLVHDEGSIVDVFSTKKLFQIMLGFSCWYQEMSDDCINIRLVISARIIGEISSFRINAGIQAPPVDLTFGASYDAAQSRFSGQQRIDTS